ncbi:HAD family hydrolase [Desulfonatronum thiodismutans]|uniref:HAD family hydrolase n=1 Tax=Desulfonatronum thiodismutans TaxID=159290 RepID=UPI00068FA8FB|nr:HAD family hydrolase [Desulfonatronum thiodismutans]
MIQLRQLPKAVIFDVDGTLYDQSSLRRKMLGDLVFHLMRSPFTGIRTIKTLAVFRRLREQMPDMKVDNLAKVQYHLAADLLRCTAGEVHAIVDEWMFKRPLHHLRACKLEYLDDFLKFLRSNGITTAVFSDYPAAQKIESLGLNFFLVLDAEDRRVDLLKPDPKGLMVCAGVLGLEPSACLFIGDRDDRDGECARRAGMPFLLYARSSCSTLNTFNSYQQLPGAFSTAHNQPN